MRISIRRCSLHLAVLACAVSLVGCATQPRGRLFASRSAPGPAEVAATLPSRQTRPVTQLPPTEESWNKKTRTVSFEDRQPARGFLSGGRSGSSCFG